MGSPLGPSLANAFLAYHGQNWLHKCPLKYRPLYYRWYVDDIFVIFKSFDNLKRFQSYLNYCQVNISSATEQQLTEQQNIIFRCQCYS